MDNPVAREMILAECGARWTKVARIIGAVMDQPRLEVADADDVGDLLTQVIRTLICEGKLEAEGDIDDWRVSEVRLAQKRSP